MNKKALSIYFSKEENELLASYLSIHKTDLITHDSMYDAQRDISKEGYCLIALDVSHLAQDTALESVSQIRLNTYAPIFVLVSEASAIPFLEVGADFCLPNTVLQEAVIGHALSLVRRYTLYNHYDESIAEEVVLHRGALTIDPRRHRATLHGEEIQLQRREFRLLYYFAKNPGIVITPERICQNVWMTNYDYNRDVSAVIAGLRRKLKDVRDNPVFIETIYGVGYRFIPLL